MKTRDYIDQARLGWAKTAGAVGTHALVIKTVQNSMRKSKTAEEQLHTGCRRRADTALLVFCPFHLLLFFPPLVSNFVSPAVFRLRSQTNKKWMCKQTRAYIRTQPRALSSAGTQGRCSVSFQCSGSDEFQLFNCLTHENTHSQTHTHREV